MASRILVICAAVIVTVTAVLTDMRMDLVAKPRNSASHDLIAYGALCDGVHDDTLAIQNWLNSIGSDVRLVAPPGVCVFSAPLQVPFANDWTIEGSGPYSTTLKYIGQASDVDLLTVSDARHGGFKDAFLGNLRIASDTRMRAGAALHVHGAFVSMFRNLVVGGFGDNDTLYDGFWFDGVGFATLIGFDAKGRGDGVLVNAAQGGTADLYLTSGRVGGFAIGLHVAGGMGGVQCDQTDFLRNGINLKIDTTVKNAPNREIKQGPNCAFDSATTGDNVLIDDQLANGGTIRLDGWIASSYHANGVHVAHWKNGDIELAGDALYNNCLDGIFISDITTRIFISSTLGIKSNGNAQVGNGACGVVSSDRGWGVNAASPTNRIYTDVRPWNNRAGSFAPNAMIERLGPSGYRKHADGLIDYWGRVTLADGEVSASIKDGDGNTPLCGGGWLAATLVGALQTGRGSDRHVFPVVIAPSNDGLTFEVVGARRVMQPSVIVWSGKCLPS